MSAPNIPDPKQFGRELADVANARMRSEGISRLKLGTVYAEDLSELAKKMVASGVSKHGVADWLEAATAAYRERLDEHFASRSKQHH
jgi:hypothetical protein